MSDERWQRIEDLFHRAADLEPGERNAYLSSACSGDRELRAEVESLLAADADSEASLEHAVAEAAEHLRAEPDEESELGAGKRIGPYAIVALIGRGGMGAVYRAVREGEFRMDVALKLLKRGTDTEASLSRFRKERQILAALQHPNIAHLLDGGATEDGLPYFAMEYVEGRPLLEYAAPLSVRQRLELFRSILAAVQHAHQNLIVHRDLKPGNILVTADGTPKLLDFGIAKLVDPQSTGGELTLTVAGTRLMTPDYASPEQVRGLPVGIPSDIYSLGVILYELLSGERPHRIATYSPEAIERAICREETRKPSTRNRQLDPDLDNIVLMALRKEPQRRYGSVEQFSEDIRRYLENRPVRARRDTLGYRTGKFVRRNKVAMLIAALAAVGLATGIVAVNRQARRAEYRFRQVRRLAHTVLFDLNPKIETLEGSTRAREMLVKTSLGYLDSLAAEAGSDTDLQLELGEAYEKIGDVQGNPKFPNLGHPEASLQSYAKALRIARKVGTSRPALELAARAYSKLGIVQAWEMGRFTEARENLRRAVQVADSLPAATGDPAYQARAEAYGLLGDCEVQDPERRMGPYRRSLQIAREWVSARPSAESRYFLLRALGRWGMFLWRTGDVNGALDSNLAALRIVDQLRREQPANAVLRTRRNLLCFDIGRIFGDPGQFNLGDRNSAATWLQGAADEFERIAAADPNNLVARFQLATASSELAEATGESDPARAERLFRRSLALTASLLQATPHDDETRDDQAGMRMGLAEVLDRLDRSREALLEMQAAVETLDALHGKNPEHLGFGLDLGEALYTRAAHRLKSGDADGAEQDLGRSLGTLEPLFRDNPHNLQALQNLANSHQGLGDLAASRSDWKRAELEYRKSLDLWERWKQVGTSSVYDRQRRDAAALLVASAEKKASGNPPSR